MPKSILVCICKLYVRVRKKNLFWLSIPGSKPNEGSTKVHCKNKLVMERKAFFLTNICKL